MPTFVGRSAELGLLRARLDEAAAGRPRTVVLEGTAGVGKSALVHAFSSSLDPASVLSASGDEAETFLPFGALMQLLGSRSATWPDPFAAGRHVLEILDQRHRDQPTVFVVDDAHLADTQSLTALTFALRRLQADRVLALVTVRDTEIGRIPSGLLRLAEAQDGRIPLSGMGVDEVRALATSRGHPRLSRRNAERLREHTGGNALYLRALMDELSPSALRQSGPLPAPQSYALLALGTLGALSDQARRLARAAAIMPDGTRLAVTAGVADVAEAEGAVEELVRANLITCRYADDGLRIGFAHALARAAVHQDVGPRERKDLHTRAAGLTTGEAALLHRAAAAHGPDPGLSAELAARARELESDGNAHRAASMFLKARALGPPGPDGDAHLMDAANLFLIAGDVTAAKDVAARLEELPAGARRFYLQAKIAWLGGEPGAAEELATLAWSRAAELDRTGRGTLAAILAQLHNVRGDGQAAADWAARALAEELPADLVDSTAAARAMGLALIGRSREALAALGSLVADPTKVGSDGQHRLTARGALRAALDDLPGARRDLEAFVGTTRGEVAPQRLVAMGVLAEVDFRLGDWDASVTLAEHAISLAEDSEQLWVLGFLHAVAMQVYGGRGAWSRAAQHLDDARRIAGVLGDPATFAVCENAGVLLASYHSEPGEVVERAQLLVLLDDGPTVEPGWLTWPAPYVSALIQLGRLDEADSAIRTFEGTARARGSRSRLAALARLRGELATARRDHPVAREAFEEALRLGDGVADALEQALALASYGRFLRRRGERRAAQERLQASRERFVSMGATPFVERCDEELAAAGLTPEPSERSPTEGLTPQEQIVARLACRGLTNNEMAHQLVLSVKTVGYHLTNVYTKLDVHSRAQLVAKMSRG